MMNKTILSIIAIFQLFAFAIADTPLTSKTAYKTWAYYNITYPANSIEGAATLNIRGRLEANSSEYNVTDVTAKGGAVEDGEPQVGDTSFIGSWNIPESALGEDITVFVKAVRSAKYSKDYNYSTPLWVLGGYTLENGTQSTFSLEI